MGIEYRRDDFTISTDKSRLNVAVIHDYLTNRAYWSRGRSLETVKKSIQHSLCFGVYKGDQQVGFARVVTDYATFGWLCDVFILEDYQDQGLGKWLVECVVKYPDLNTLQRIMLATRDAHQLYRRYGGFENLDKPERWMARLISDD